VDKREVLKNKFGYADFRQGQEEVIDAILAGKDALAIMPTGAGKSLCYQIPALLLPGVTIVISPLISLMKDQVKALNEAGCPAAFLNSSQNPAEYAAAMRSITGGEAKLVYIAPERLQRPDVQRLAESGALSLVVVDEAHCVSQWGHDFRTSYLEIADFIRRIKPRPVTAAFTATATVEVREDIRQHLALRKPFAITTGFDRPNLSFAVSRAKDKKGELLNFLAKREKSSGIIYCATRKLVEEVCAMLQEKGFSATRYHAGLEEGERRKNQDDFTYDRKTLMVATNAFGMGIDKSNVAFVLHYNMPKNIESYYQEAGRAGRDGAPAECMLLYSGQDVKTNEFLIKRGDDDGDVNYELQAHNLELLKQMTFYATSADCLRRRFLSYFGEAAPAYCGNCSNCLSEYDEADVTTEARKIISCVYRLKQRGRSFGKTMIIDILRGSKSEKIMSGGFDSLSTYGIMAAESAQKTRSIFDYLIEEGLLIQEAGEYPVISIGVGVEEVLREERRLVMKLLRKQPDEKASPRAGGVNPGEAATPWAADDEALLEKLKTLRKKIAAQESVPAYMVFSDASLQDMCRKRPTSLAQFSAVTGVGQIKQEKYGEIFTALIRGHK